MIEMPDDIALIYFVDGRHEALKGDVHHDDVGVSLRTTSGDDEVKELTVTIYPWHTIARAILKFR